MSENIATTIKVPVEGVDLDFAKWSPRDRSLLAQKLKAERRPKWIALLKEGGVTGREFINEVDAFDALPFTVDHLVGFINRPEGSDYVVTYSAKKSFGDEKGEEYVKKLVLDHGDVTQLAFDLAGIKVVYRDPNANGEQAPDADTSAERQAESGYEHRPSAPASS